MPSKADIEEPISLVRPMHARTVQAILDRAHQQERSANERVQQTVANNLRAGRSKGDLSMALGLVLSHHGRTRKGGPSIRPVAPDSGGRAFHFSHSTVGRKTGAKAGATGGARGAESGPASGGDGGETSTDAGLDLGSREAGHQRYVERDAALARDAAETFGHEVGTAASKANAGADRGNRREAAAGIDTAETTKRKDPKAKPRDRHRGVQGGNREGGAGTQD